MRKLIGLVALLAVIALGWYWLTVYNVDAVAGDEPASLIPLLSEPETGGFARATEPGAISFPRDLGPHDAYRLEWWYYTGNLETAAGRPFGFQFTIFRIALTPEDEAPAGNSDWRTNQLYLAHFTISDIEGNAFYPTERFSRGAAGLAGAQASPYRVWLEDWTIEEVGPGQVWLRAATGEVSLDLVLTQRLPPVLHGDAGLSQKGPEPGNASYYYSIVQQAAEGTVVVDGRSYPVTGVAWKDHEYSTSALSPGAVGWDWFSLQFDDGTALMFFQIRREDGSLEPYSSGSFITADGGVVPVEAAEWELAVLGNWTSPTSGATYPAGWRLVIEGLDLVLEGRPLLANQELNVSTTYWEGAVEFTGTREGAPVRARGYVEMTGYE